MKPNHTKTRIIYFIGSLSVGGKERRLIELLTYLQCKEEYELMVVVTDPIIGYPSFYKLNINYQVIRKSWKRYDPSIFYKFYKKCKQFKPHIIHTWGRMQSLFAIPTALAQGIPLVNGQITGAPSNLKRWSFNGIVDQINFSFSKIILSNSQAGINAYRPPAKKARVIYNGINLCRFENLGVPESIKFKYGIKTPHAVIMVASFSDKKDYPMFFSIAQQITSTRDDISFVAVGDGTEVERYSEQITPNPRIILTGRINDVESLVNCCDIGVLFSNKISGEGISNSIIEYMSLSKPVIAIDAGGTKEVVHHEVNGYLIDQQTEKEIIALITGLIDDPEKCTAFGKAGRKIIERSFLLDRMGQAFVQTYQDVLSGEELTKGNPNILFP